MGSVAFELSICLNQSHLFLGQKQSLDHSVKHAYTHLLIDFFQSHKKDVIFPILLSDFVPY